MPDLTPTPQLHTTVVLAMSADGKIADRGRSPAHFGSAVDKAHLERQIALADAVLFGASTLRAYGTTLTLQNPELLQQRQQQQRSPQPTHIVCSRSAQLDPQFPFFRQAVPRWLLTTPPGAQQWQEGAAFERVLAVGYAPHDGEQLDWATAFQALEQAGFKRLVVLGGGTLVASLVAGDWVDEFWLTLCPLILGGDAPTPVDGAGFTVDLAPRLHLLSAETVDQEVFLHYRCERSRSL